MSPAKSGMKGDFDTPDADKALELAAAMYQIAEGHETAIVIAALCSIMAGLMAELDNPRERMASLALDMLNLVRTLEANPEENPLLAFIEIRLRQKAVHQ